ncbi:MAG: acyltransferase [Opitutae bacterium]|nr:acyltransferase [Opitutae bacterium]
MNAVPSSPTPATERNLYIDALRGWSIFGVVCIHFAGSFVTSDSFAWSPSFLLGLALNQGFIFAVPLFVFLSGLLASSSRREVSLADYYRGRFRRIVVPYLVASLAAFFLLNHYLAWLDLHYAGRRAVWLLERLLLKGVEPTFYFIPMILQLYLLQPLFKALPRWLNRLSPALTTDRAALGLMAFFLALHVTLGVLCNRNVLDYYVWGRPNGLFWAFYFFAGLHFESVRHAVTPRLARAGRAIALLAAGLAVVWNFSMIFDIDVVGGSFERNRLDYAYVRPEMLIYDLAVVAILATGLLLGSTARRGLATYVGRFTLEIYLWHIIVLYYGAWRYAGAIASCRELPELIVVLAASATLLIAFAADGWYRLKDFVRHHRLRLVRVG